MVTPTSRWSPREFSAILVGQGPLCTYGPRLLPLRTNTRRVFPSRNERQNVCPQKLQHNRLWSYLYAWNWRTFPCIPDLAPFLFFFMARMAVSAGLRRSVLVAKFFFLCSLGFHFRFGIEHSLYLRNWGSPASGYFTRTCLHSCSISARLSRRFLAGSEFPSSPFLSSAASFRILSKTVVILVILCGPWLELLKALLSASSNALSMTLFLSTRSTLSLSRSPFSVNIFKVFGLDGLCLFS